VILVDKRVELISDYCLYICAYDIVLKKKRVGVKKDGSENNYEEFIGSFGSYECLFKRLHKELVKDKLKDNNPAKKLYKAIKESTKEINEMRRMMDG
jgi:uncharacterized protein YutD